jgi:anionic cell wall polymer biosynthesis LytR-Cps2A-Psr (LCP) family protein
MEACMRRVILALAILLSGCQSVVETQEVVEPTVTSTPIVLPTKEVTVTPTPFLPATNTPTSVPTPDPGKRYTAVLMGVDRDSFGWGARTDAFIIITAIVYEDRIENPARIHMIYVPRDLLVQVYDPNMEGYYQDRINAAYHVGGFDGVRMTVARTFGLDVNAGVAVVDPLGYMDIVDQMNLIIRPYQDFNQVCPYYDRDFKFILDLDSDQDYKLNGVQALCYVRHRGFGFEDRIKRFHDSILGFRNGLLPAIAEGHGPAILENFKTSVKTSIELEEIVGLLGLVTKIKGAAYFPETFELGEEVEFYTTETGASTIRPLVDLRQWTEEILE